MKCKIVADSSASLYRLEGVEFESVPLKVLTDEKEYVDNEQLNVHEMLEELSRYKGKSYTSCPNMEDWLRAFGDAEMILGVSISGNISGSYNAARMAAEEYTEQHPERKVFILDSLSAGPETEMMVEKYLELLEQGRPFEEICEAVKDYLSSTKLLFSLASVQNFANNGRINPAIAKAAKLLHINVLGRASADGKLEPLYKCRGQEKALHQLVACMKEDGYHGGRVRIHHTENLAYAESIAAELRKDYPDCDLEIGVNNGLCAFYSERGGVLVGYETK